jgi:hypothetical protein
MDPAWYVTSMVGLLALGSGVCAQPLDGQVMVAPDNPARRVYNRDDDGNGKLDPFFMCGPAWVLRFWVWGTASMRNGNGGKASIRAWRTRDITCG